MLKFTFQYVSINTAIAQMQRDATLDLHSNMFLLIHATSDHMFDIGTIYIPICFY